MRVRPSNASSEHWRRSDGAPDGRIDLVARPDRALGETDLVGDGPFAAGGAKRAQGLRLLVGATATAIGSARSAGHRHFRS